MGTFGNNSDEVKICVKILTYTLLGTSFMLPGEEQSVVSIFASCSGVIAFNKNGKFEMHDSNRS